MSWATIDVASARELVDLKHSRRESQLEGAVAVHNILQRERVAYLADEVGLGKTYVALTTVALMRHYQPGFRVLVIAPRSNIQRKWTNDWRAFVANNWLSTDLRVKGASGTPARPLEVYERLIDLVDGVGTSPDNDVFARLPSFSFAVAGDEKAIRERVQRVLPWLKASDFPKNERRLRDFVAQAYNAALPTFDLVIIDEAHNLKSGVQIEDGVVQGGALRNTVLAQVLGHPDVVPDERFSDVYRPLADRVLLLSATPVEESFKHLWNQLHLVGKHEPPGRADFADLKVSDEAAQAAASRILVRRINTISVNGVPHTKNHYRRTWYHGGVSTHDEPLEQGTLRQRLSVALVQKKVSDLIGTRFNNQFQMGMLASFESFAETALKQPDEHGTAKDDDEATTGTFDGDQTNDAAERQGIDTGAINTLARDHYETFGTELAHPKMDALVADLASAWRTGTKSLVFVRRVASVAEIKRKVDETYDDWLLERLRAELPEPVLGVVEKARSDYLRQRAHEGRHVVGQGDGPEDQGGADTFFAWFFRGTGPTLGSVGAARESVESGAGLARALGSTSGAASTFFAENYLADLLDCASSDVLEALAQSLGRPTDAVVADLEERARHYLPSSSGRRESYDAVQSAGVELLRTLAPAGSTVRRSATVLYDELQLAPRERRDLAVDVRAQLATPTFFSRLGERPALAADLLPTVARSPRDRAWVREHFLRTAVLARAARLGQPFIDLYVTFMNTTAAGSVTDRTEVDAAIEAYLDLLEAQRSGEAATGAYRELREIADNFALLCQQNLPNTTRDGFVLASAGAECGTLLGRQQPAVGMAGRVNQTAVRQFRMPGYPYVLVCTDVLQEGEDLHTYCDRVVHYGVAWTASAMEQRTGRVDRINSLAERRFGQLDQAGTQLVGDAKIQVQLPYLTETVERLQARTVLRRMHTFVSLMHEGIEKDDPRLDLTTEMLKEDWTPPAVEHTLESSFGVKPTDLKGRTRARLTSEAVIGEWWERLVALSEAPGFADCFIDGGRDRDRLALFGTRQIGERVQPFSLHLLSRDSMPVVSARTPVARRPDVEGDVEALVAELSDVLDRVVVLNHANSREYDVSICADLFLADPEHDVARVLGMVTRITDQADQVEAELTRHDLALAQVRSTLQKDIRS